MENVRARPLLHLCTLLGVLCCLIFAAWGWHNGILTSREALSALIRSSGPWGPLVFLIVQTVQVVIPILPGGVSCLIGVLLFGPYWGFLYNYLGSCLGSLAAFGIAKLYGRPVLERLFPQTTLEKYDRWTKQSGRFDRWFALAILFPVAPDDFLCYLAGTTKLSWRRFTMIIWLCKPFSIALYSLLLAFGWDCLLQWLL